jgi:hypothetical protein
MKNDVNGSLTIQMSRFLLKDAYKTSNFIHRVRAKDHHSCVSGPSEWFYYYIGHILSYLNPSVMLVSVLTVMMGMRSDIRRIAIPA